MRLLKKSISESLPPSLKAMKPSRGEFENFKSKLTTYLERAATAAAARESEEHLKTHLMDLFKGIFGSRHFVEQQERIDFVIRVGGARTAAGVLFEHKRSSNRAEMISAENCNRRALHELVLHFMRERQRGNVSIRHLVVCSEAEFFIFDATDFERIFFNDHEFRGRFEQWAAGRTTDQTTDFFYNEIALPFIEHSAAELKATHFSIIGLAGTVHTAPDRKLLQLFKIFSPQYLLETDLPNDSNQLNKSFYDELLHIIGLEEREENSEKRIGRLKEANRKPGSIIENTIDQLRLENDFHSSDFRVAYGENNEERAYRISLELCLIWINRILFLKLLEGQLVKFHQDDQSFRFLNTALVADYDEVRDLFFKVLAFKQEERTPDIRLKYSRVPYLNSSLFEKSPLEKLVGIESLNSRGVLPVFARTVLRDAKGRRLKGNLPPLDYLFRFLDAYDFGATAGGEIREESKSIISAAVLGLIFEKINGYKEGAIFTPGYITMFMARDVIETTVLERFRSLYPTWSIESVDDLRSYLADYRSRDDLKKFNAVIDSLTICDPAVGSGHFLVSCLNELIALKSRLGILCDAEGSRITDFYITVDNDELIILSVDTDNAFYYQISDGRVPARSQMLQKALFHEKQTLIENCLFGVDINPNSVRICQLRLWIELLKSAYYRDGVEGELETLPNIDINIKCGNSLLSRFKLDSSLSQAFRRARLTVSEYRRMVQEYKKTKDKNLKRALQSRLDQIKGTFQREALDTLTARIDKRIEELHAQEAQLDLFILGHDEQIARDVKLEEIYAELEQLQARREAIHRDQTFRSAFEWRFEFPEILDDRGQYTGFDIVIANPPYMRIQGIEASQAILREFYERDFTTARGSYDLANLFFELALRVSAKSISNNIFIFPHKLFNSENGESLREYIANSTAIKKLTHFGANQIFSSAVTYTCIALFNDRESDKFGFKRYKMGREYEKISVIGPDYNDLYYRDVAEASRIYGTNQWFFFDSAEGFSVFSKLYLGSRPLGSILDVGVGLQTSRDSLYVCRKLAEGDDYFDIEINPDRKNEDVPILTAQLRVEKTWFKPFLFGKDVHRYETLQTDRLVFFPYRVVNGRAILVTLAELQGSFPLTYQFLAEYEVAFRAREKGKAGLLQQWHAYIYPKNLATFETRKLVSMEICSSHPNVTVDFENIYHSTTVYSLTKLRPYPVSYESIAAILNSSLLWWWLKITGDTLQGDARRMKTNYLNPFPLPELVDPAIDLKISGLVNDLMVAKRDFNHADVVRLEEEIDVSVHQLYQLSEAESKIVRAAGRVT